MWMTTYRRAHFYQKTFCYNFYQVQPHLVFHWPHYFFGHFSLDVLINTFLIKKSNCGVNNIQQMAKAERNFFNPFLDNVIDNEKKIPSNLFFWMYIVYFQFFEKKTIRFWRVLHLNHLISNFMLLKSLVYKLLTSFHTSLFPFTVFCLWLPAKLIHGGSADHVVPQMLKRYYVPCWSNWMGYYFGGWIMYTFFSYKRQVFKRLSLDFCQKWTFKNKPRLNFS